MSKMNYNHARKTLNQIFENYLVHNNAQLDALIPTATWEPAYTFFEEVLGRNSPGSGFLDWVTCHYTQLINSIVLLDLDGPRIRGAQYYEEVYPPCEFKIKFLSPSLDRDGIYRTDYPATDENGYVNPKLVLDRLTLLNGLLQYIMVEENKVLDFEKNLQDHCKNESKYLFTDSDPLSIKIYNSLKKLKQATCYINDALPMYHKRYIAAIVRDLDESFPIYEGYIKGIAVQELKSILDDPTLSDKDAVKAVASQLKNKAILDILGKNRQSETEHILKVLSVVLIAVGIGIVPTLILATKRLYDTGGTSINFFKPLSQNLCEDAQDITADVSFNEEAFKTSSSSLI